MKMEMELAHLQKVQNQISNFFTSTTTLVQVQVQVQLSLLQFFT